MKIKESISVLQNKLKKDKNYYKSWHSSITMAFIDTAFEYKKNTKKKKLNQSDLEIISRNASDLFLSWLT